MEWELLPSEDGGNLGFKCGALACCQTPVSQAKKVLDGARTQDFETPAYWPASL